MKKDVLIALSTYIFLFIVTFILSIGFGLGEAESTHDPNSLLLYGRRILMIIFAIAVPWFTRKHPPSALGWKLSVKWIFISLAVGLFMGSTNPGGFNPKDPLAILLALFHTFSTELYFRGYLFTTFERSMKGWWVPLLLSSFLYGLFYLTVWPIWARPPLAKMIFVVGFTLVAMPFGYGYKKSGSFFVPWMMHFFGVLKYTMLF
jgi:hypothetical protein